MADNLTGARPRLEELIVTLVVKLSRLLLHAGPEPPQLESHEAHLLPRLAVQLGKSWLDTFLDFISSIYLEVGEVWPHKAASQWPHSGLSVFWLSVET